MFSFKVNYKTLLTIFAWSILLSGYPVILTSAIRLPYILPLFLGLFGLIIFLFRVKRLKTIKAFNILFAINFSFWALQLGCRFDFAYISNIFQLFVLYVFYLFVCNLDRIDIKRQFVKLIAIVSAVGAVSAFFVFVFDLNPLFSYVAHDGRSAYIFPFTGTNVYYTAPRHLIRFSGIFDEPGTIAYFSMIALIINKCFIGNKMYERVLLLAPCLTFSLAHYVTVFLYLFLFRILKLRYLILSAIFGVSLFAFAEKMQGTELEVVYNLTFKRLNKSDDRGFEGNNRSDLADAAFDYFQQAPVFGFGKTFFESDDKPHVGDNFYFIGALFGIMGYLVVYSFLWYGMLKAFINFHLAFSRIVLRGYFIIFINLFQRPYLTNILTTCAILLIIISATKIINTSKYGTLR